MRIIQLKKDVACAECGKDLIIGERVKYYTPTKIYCENGHKKDIQTKTASVKKPFVDFLTDMKKDLQSIIKKIEEYSTISKNG